MDRTINIAAILMVLTFAALGCSGKNSNPVEPGNAGSSAGPIIVSDSGRALLGAWTIQLDPSTMSATVLPNRSIVAHLNPGHSLQDPPGDVIDIVIVNPRYNAFFCLWDFDTILVNLNSENDLFDVRGIILPDEEPFEPCEVLGLNNDDGATTVWDPGGQANRRRRAE